MPRNASGVYAPPPGSAAINGSTISPATFNALIDDIAADMNAPRPVSAGGTGATSPDAAASAIGAARKAVAETISEAWTWAVNKAVRFGATHNIFSDGTALRLRGNGTVFFQSADGTKSSLIFDPNGSAILHNNGVERLRTNSTGVAITGGATITGDVAITGVVSGSAMATQPQAEAQTAINILMSPLRTRQLINAAFPSSASEQGFPGGLKFRWGTFSVGPGSGAVQSVLFTPPFSSALSGVMLTPFGAAAQQMGVSSQTRLGFTANKGDADTSARSGYWLAWGF